MRKLDFTRNQMDSFELANGGANAPEMVTIILKAGTQKAVGEMLVDGQMTVKGELGRLFDLREGTAEFGGVLGWWTKTCSVEFGDKAKSALKQWISTDTRYREKIWYMLATGQPITGPKASLNTADGSTPPAVTPPAAAQPREGITSPELTLAVDLLHERLGQEPGFVLNDAILRIDGRALPASFLPAMKAALGQLFIPPTHAGGKPSSNSAAAWSAIERFLRDLKSPDILRPWGEGTTVVKPFIASLAHALTVGFEPYMRPGARVDPKDGNYSPLTSLFRAAMNMTQPPAPWNASWAAGFDTNEPVRWLPEQAIVEVFLQQLREKEQRDAQFAKQEQERKLIADKEAAEAAQLQKEEERLARLGEEYRAFDTAHPELCSARRELPGAVHAFVRECVKRDKGAVSPDRRLEVGQRFRLDGLIAPQGAKCASRESLAAFSAALPGDASKCKGTVLGSHHLENVQVSCATPGDKDLPPEVFGPERPVVLLRFGARRRPTQPPIDVVGAERVPESFRKACVELGTIFEDEQRSLVPQSAEVKRAIAELQTMLGLPKQERDLDAALARLGHQQYESADEKGWRTICPHTAASNSTIDRVKIEHPIQVRAEGNNIRMKSNGGTAVLTNVPAKQVENSVASQYRFWLGGEGHTMGGVFISNGVSLPEERWRDLETTGANSPLMSYVLNTRGDGIRLNNAADLSKATTRSMYLTVAIALEDADPWIRVVVIDDGGRLHGYDPTTKKVCVWNGSTWQYNEPGRVISDRATRWLDTLPLLPQYLRAVTDKASQMRVEGDGPLSVAAADDASRIL